MSNFFSTTKPKKQDYKILTLSDKKVSDITSEGNVYFYPEKDVKEFIKRIKERINQITFSIEDEKHIIKVINDEAGEKLIK